MFPCLSSFIHGYWALALYDVWRTNPDYLAVSHLAKVIKNIPPPQFRQLSHFLTQPHWEATNNGAERTGRAFRHLQGLHFNLRKSQSIEGAIKIVACLDQAKLQQPPSEPMPVNENLQERIRGGTRSDRKPGNNNEQSDEMIRWCRLV